MNHRFAWLLTIVAYATLVVACQQDDSAVRPDTMATPAADARDGDFPDDTPSNGENADTRQGSDSDDADAEAGGGDQFVLCDPFVVCSDGDTLQGFSDKGCPEEFPAGRTGKHEADSMVCSGPEDKDHFCLYCDKSYRENGKFSFPDSLQNQPGLRALVICDDGVHPGSGYGCF